MNFSIQQELQLFVEKLQRYLTITYLDNYSTGLSVLLKNMRQNLS
ncbi:hypothetical protein [Bacillus wiedmannii]